MKETGEVEETFEAVPPPHVECLLQPQAKGSDQQTQTTFGTFIQMSLDSWRYPVLRTSATTVAADMPRLHSELRALDSFTASLQERGKVKIYFTSLPATSGCTFNASTGGQASSPEPGTVVSWEGVNRNRHEKIKI